MASLAQSNNSGITDKHLWQTVVDKGSKSFNKPLSHKCCLCWIATCTSISIRWSWMIWNEAFINRQFNSDMSTFISKVFGDRGWHHQRWLAHVQTYKNYQLCNWIFSKYSLSTIIVHWINNYTERTNWKGTDNIVWDLWQCVGILTDHFKVIWVIIGDFCSLSIKKC